MTIKELATMLVEDNFESWRKLLQNEEIRQFVLGLPETMQRLQIAKIREGFEEGLTLQQVKIYSYPEFTEYRMHLFKEMFKEYHQISVESLAKKIIAEAQIQNMKDVSDEQIKTILKHSYNLSKETMLRYADARLSTAKLAIIYQALSEGVSEQKIDLISQPGFLLSEVEELMAAIKQDLTIERLQICTKSLVNKNQRSIIIQGAKEGDSLQQINFYADGELTCDEMKEIRAAFKLRKHSPAMDIIVNHYAECPSELKMLLIKATVANKKITQMQLENIVQNYGWNKSPNKIIIDILKK